MLWNKGKTSDRCARRAAAERRDAAAWPTWSAAAMLLFSLGGAAQAETAEASVGATSPVPRTVAVISAIGDRITIVRQREQTGTHLAPYTRKEVRLDPVTLNRLVLDGIDEGFNQSEPQTRRVLLDWLPPEEAMAYVDEKRYVQREERLEALLIEHLRAVPERSQWDEIVAVLPKWHMSSVKGMGERLAGIGIYIQPLARERYTGLESSGNGDLSLQAEGQADGDYQTIDPKTGEKGASSVFVAVYMYFQTVTLDARTLAVKKREVRRDSVRYHDPNSTAINIGRMFDSGFLSQALSNVVQRSSERAVTGDVIVSPARKLEAPAETPKP